MTAETWEEAVERGAQSRLAQGLERTITDPTVLTFIAGMVVDLRRRQTKTAKPRKKAS